VTPRERRIIADFNELRSIVSPHISVVPVGAEPPESYRVTYHLRGVTLGMDGQPAISDRQQVLFRLGPTYPREGPLLVAETAIFHPNVPAAIGHEFSLYERWTPADSLWDVMVTMAGLIQFQRYDVDQAQNPSAAAWVTANPRVFPIGAVDLAVAQSG
jgi:ubiquitin-protein ligase